MCCRGRFPAAAGKWSPTTTPREKHEKQLYHSCRHPREMGKTFRRRTPANSSDCIRNGGFSSAIQQSNACGWPEHYGSDRPSAAKRSQRPDGALKNKARRQVSARAQKQQELLSADVGFGFECHSWDDLVNCQHVTKRCPRSIPEWQFHAAQPSQPTQQPNCRLSQLPGDSFEEKLVNGMASDVSQICLAEVLKNASFVSSKGRNTVELHVPLCLDFNVRQLECINLQLVKSKAETDEAHTRPWFSSGSFEHALSRSLERGVAKGLAVRCTNVKVFSKASLGYARYTTPSPWNGRPQLYMWSTGLVPYVTIRVGQPKDASHGEFLCVHRHFSWWRYAVACGTKKNASHEKQMHQKQMHSHFPVLHPTLCFGNGEAAAACQERQKASAAEQTQGRLSIATSSEGQQRNAADAVEMKLKHTAIATTRRAVGHAKCALQHTEIAWSA